MGCTTHSSAAMLSLRSSFTTDSEPSAPGHRSQTIVHSIDDDRGFGSDHQFPNFASIVSFCFLGLGSRQSSPSPSIWFATHVVATLARAAIIILSQPYSEIEEGRNRDGKHRVLESREPSGITALPGVGVRHGRQQTQCP